MFKHCPLSYSRSCMPFVFSSSLFFLVQGRSISNAALNFSSSFPCSAFPFFFVRLSEKVLRVRLLQSRSIRYAKKYYKPYGLHKSHWGLFRGCFFFLYFWNFLHGGSFLFQVLYAFSLFLFTNIFDCCARRSITSVATKATTTSWRLSRYTESPPATSATFFAFCWSCHN